MTASSRADDQKLDGRRSGTAGLIVAGLARAEVAHQRDAMPQRTVRWSGSRQRGGIQPLGNHAQAGSWLPLSADDPQRLTATALLVQGATTKESTGSLATAARVASPSAAESG